MKACAILQITLKLFEHYTLIDEMDNGEFKMWRKKFFFFDNLQMVIIESYVRPRIQKLYPFTV